MKRIFLMTSTVILSLWLVSCEKTDTGIPTSAAMDSASNRSHGVMVLHKQPIKPLLQYCDEGGIAVNRYYWESQNQYMAVQGKSVGVWDGDAARQQTYKDQYGHTTAIGGYGAVDTYLQVGFSPSNITVALSESGGGQDVDNALERGITRFYIDEPIHNNRQQFVVAAASYIGSQGGNLTISEAYDNPIAWALGERGEIGEMIQLAVSTQPMTLVGCHSSFQHHSYGTTDPRDQWNYINGQVPGLFRMAWIKTYQTTDEMYSLFAYANTLGINQILLMPFDLSETFVGRVELATEVGWANGWLSKLQQRVCQQWCCPTTTWDPEVCTLQSWWYTGETRWY